MGVPACLWRRTGEIYKGNREFSELVGVDGYMLRDVSLLLCNPIGAFLTIEQGRLCIYELMAEESAVNYWEVCALLHSALKRKLFIDTSTEIWQRCIRPEPKSSLNNLRPPLKTSHQTPVYHTWRC